MTNSFLLIGQSNMAGRGYLDEIEPIDNKEILMFRAGKWMTAMEPLHADKPALAGIGLGMSFADTLQKKFNKKIGLIPCAFGGSALSEWQKGGRLYENAVASTLKALNGSVLKGILWHQGETDSDFQETAESYKERFLPFIKSLMTDIGASNIPVVIGELGDFLASYEQCTFWETVNSQLAEIVSEEDYFGLVSAAGLTHNGDFLHFNAKSQRELGRRFAKSWEESSRKLGVYLD